MGGKEEEDRLVMQMQVTHQTDYNLSFVILILLKVTVKMIQLIQIKNANKMQKIKKIKEEN